MLFLPDLLQRSWSRGKEEDGLKNYDHNIWQRYNKCDTNKMQLYDRFVDGMTSSVARAFQITCNDLVEQIIGGIVDIWNTQEH